MDGVGRRASGVRGKKAGKGKRPVPPREEKEESVPDAVPCFFHPCNSGADSILLFCHGNAEDLGHTQPKLAKLCNTLRVHVIGIEYTGYGISPGTPSEGSCNDDVLVVYRFLTEFLKWPTQNILLFGYSIGTGPTCALAARQDVGGLVLLAPYTSIRDMAREVLPKGIGHVAALCIANRFVNSVEMRKVKCPTLIIHGKQDKLIPHSHAQTLFDNCTVKEKRLYLVETLAHCYTEDDFECYVLFPLMDFLAEHKQVLGKAGPPRDLVFPPRLFEKPAYPAHMFAPAEAKDSKDKKDKGPKRGSHCMPIIVQPEGQAGGADRARRGSRHRRDSGVVLGMTPPTSEMVGIMAPRVMEAAAEWECAMCTFLNQPVDARCEMCRNPRTV